MTVATASAIGIGSASPIQASRTQKGAIATTAKVMMDSFVGTHDAKAVRMRTKNGAKKKATDARTPRNVR